MPKFNIKIAVHQGLSFSPAFAYTKGRGKLFWPGCAVLALGSELTLGMYQLLQEHIPDLGITTMCCGKPTGVLGAAPMAWTEKYLKQKLAKYEVTEIYTLCPNCHLHLAKMLPNQQLRIISLWEMLPELLPTSTTSLGQMLLHDPCPCRKQPAVWEGVRGGLRKLGVEVVEFPKNCQHTICCGKINMLHTTNPQLAAKIMQQRMQGAPDLPVVTYCAACVSSFQEYGVEARHILEIMFAASGQGSWGKRYQEVNAIKKLK